MLVPLSGNKATKEFQVNFDWVFDATQQTKDALTFQLAFYSAAYAAGDGSIDRADGYDLFSFNPGLDVYGTVVRCDRRVATNSDGCIFPHAAAVFVEKRSEVPEHAQQMADALAWGAPGAFKMKSGYRAIADDSVRGGDIELKRTQIEVMKAANHSATCVAAASIIKLRPQASGSCPNGSGGTTGCDCDEYPFQSTYQGGWALPERTSAKHIKLDDNQQSGRNLEKFYRTERVLDLSVETGIVATPSNPAPAIHYENGGDPFWVFVKN